MTIDSQIRRVFDRGGYILETDVTNNPPKLKSSALKFTRKRVGPPTHRPALGKLVGMIWFWARSRPSKPHQNAVLEMWSKSFWDLNCVDREIGGEVQLTIKKNIVPRWFNSRPFDPQTLEITDRQPLSSGHVFTVRERVQRIAMVPLELLIFWLRKWVTFKLLGDDAYVTGKNKFKSIFHGPY